jgi:phage shock protein PspC (stress-responsive transcriptional regulator)
MLTMDSQTPHNDDDDRDPTEPTEPVTPPPPPPPPPPPTPRRLTRSRTDRVVAGVGGGLAQHLGADPLLVRFGIALVVILTGGVGLLLYAAAWLLVPDEPLAAGQELPAPRSRAQTIAGFAVLVILACIMIPAGFAVGWLTVPFALLALAGLGVWWLVLGIPVERTGRGVLVGILLGLTVLVVAFLLFFAGMIGVAGGGGLVVAGVVTAAGLTLVASAFLRPLRWLIVPALALGLGAGTAVAAGVEDVGGSTGERFYRPATAADIRPHYELGAGHLVIDLRNVDLQGEHRIDVDLGAGHVQVLVPEGVCVASDLHAGIGGLELFDRTTGGIDVDRVDDGQAPAASPRVVVRGDVGMGYFEIDHENDSDAWEENWHDNWRDRSGVRERDSDNACIGDRGAQG